MPSGIEYDTTDKADARRWTYWDIQQLRDLVAHTHDHVDLRGPRVGSGFGADRAFDFEVREESISPRSSRSFWLTWTGRWSRLCLPPFSKTSLFRLLVKHERHGRGSDGVLLMYDNALVYGTERAADTRYWRFNDIFAICRSTATGCRSWRTKEALASCDHSRSN